MYLAQGQSEKDFQQDYELAKKLYREMRIQEIRGKKKGMMGMLDESEGKFDHEENRLASKQF